MSFPVEKIITGKMYYCLKWVISKDGKLELVGYTAWVGYADKDCKIELRKFDFVNPDTITKFWVKMEMPFFVVNDVDDYIEWYRCGGNALVQEELAKDVLKNSLGPRPSVTTGPIGFISPDLLPSNVFNKAPNPKKRMEILKRDNLKCKICGRKPENYSDLELHVHHIRPTGERGLTHEDNLITLCSTCHKGLDPHFDWSLFYSLENNLTKNSKEEYLKEIEMYKKVREQN